MLKKSLLLISLLIPMLFLSQESMEELSNEIVNSSEVISSEIVAANEVLGMDEKIDKAFGSATGWFVELIFAEIKFSEELSVPWVLIV
ncbi:MAG: hypothetical protein ACI9E3_000332, partial [Flavobacteriales bacterium]